MVKAGGKVDTYKSKRSCKKNFSIPILPISWIYAGVIYARLVIRIKSFIHVYQFAQLELAFHKAIWKDKGCKKDFVVFVQDAYGLTTLSFPPSNLPVKILFESFLTQGKCNHR
jgi:hypothetical protein